MTKLEFYNSIPEMIIHRAWGSANLRVEDKPDIKTACYIDKEGTHSFSQTGSTWNELYKNLSKSLRSEGYLKMS